MSKHLAAFILIVTLGPCALVGQTPQQAPLTQNEVRDLIKNNKEDPDVVFKTLDERGVDFDMNTRIEMKMRRAGADNVMLQAIWKAGPTSRNASAATLTSPLGVPLQATYEEAMGFQTMQDELDPDTKLRMVDEFERRFPDSQLLSYVYTEAAEAYQRRGDLNKLVEYGEKSLKLDRDNIFSIILVAIALAQPRMLQGTPDQAAQRLSAAQNYANRALELIDGLPKQANETDKELQKRKSALASDAHTTLGMVCMLRDDSGKAIEEFKTAISLSERPNPQLYFRLGEVYANHGKKPEAIEAFTKASELGRGTILQQYADERVRELKN